MKTTVIIFCFAMFMVSCEKADHDESCLHQTRTTEENDSTDTTNLNTNIGAEGWGETVNVKF